MTGRFRPRFACARAPSSALRSRSDPKPSTPRSRQDATFHAAQQGFNPVSHRDPGDDSEAIDEEVPDLPIPVDGRHERLDDLGDGRQADSREDDQGVPPPGFPHAEPKYGEPGEYPPMDQLVEVRDLEDGRLALDFLYQLAGEPAHRQDRERPEDGRYEPEDPQAAPVGRSRRRQLRRVWAHGKGIHRSMSPE